MLNKCVEDLPHQTFAKLLHVLSPELFRSSLTCYLPLIKHCFTAQSTVTNSTTNFTVKAAAQSNDHHGLSLLCHNAFQGDQGEPGDKGMDGSPGVPGLPGEPGQDGFMGLKGEKVQRT